MDGRAGGRAGGWTRINEDTGRRKATSALLMCLFSSSSRDIVRRPAGSVDECDADLIFCFPLRRERMMLSGSRRRRRPSNCRCRCPPLLNRPPRSAACVRIRISEFVAASPEEKKKSTRIGGLSPSSSRPAVSGSAAARGRYMPRCLLALGRVHRFRPSPSSWPPCRLSAGIGSRQVRQHSSLLVAPSSSSSRMEKKKRRWKAHAMRSPPRIAWRGLLCP